MIKKIQIELTFFILLTILVLLSSKIDIEIYKYFSEINYGSGAPYLKLFFTKITELGDSLWYFLLLLLIFCISFLFKKNNLITNKKYLYLKNFSIFSFTYILLTGFVTQTIKRLIGRTRPNHIDISEEIYFDFFTTNSGFHSFPSGHASTIIAVTLIFCLIIPSLRVLLFISGSIIAISRVVVGAHHFTDIVAGTLIAIIIYKVMIFFYKKNFPKINFDGFIIKKISTLTKINIVFIIIAIFLTIGPGLDIYLSSLFYNDNNQFMLQSYYMTSVLFRKILLPFLIIYIFVLPIISKFSFIKKIFFNYSFSFKDILFIWVSGPFTLVLFVNVLLKDMWGRTRPNDISSFGGDGNFTPWYKFGDSCVSNCSFVSGDASVGFALIVFYFITKKNIFCYLSLFFGTVLGFIRIIAGGHFFSDVVFAQLLVTTSLSALFIIYTKLYAK